MNKSEFTPEELNLMAEQIIEKGLNKQQQKQLRDVYSFMKRQNRYEGTSIEPMIQQAADQISKIGESISIRGKEETVTYDRVKNYFSDNKHMSYFDNFLGSGEAAKIEQALKEYNISAGVLEGVKHNIRDTQVSRYNKDVEWEQYTNKDYDASDPESIYIVEFIIKYKGKEIYRFTREDEEYKGGDIENEVTKSEAIWWERIGYDIEPIQTKQKEGSTSKGLYQFVGDKGTIKVYQRKTKSDKTIKEYRMKGKFVSRWEFVNE